MIYFVVESVGRTAISYLLTDWGKALAERVRIVDYRTLLRQKRLQIGTYIFTGTEHLDDTRLEAVARCWQALRDTEAGVKLLNHPLRSMRRYELLRTLFERGINNFDIYRLNEVRQPKRFPVFIRGENDHHGVPSGLIECQEQLKRTVSEMICKGQSPYRYTMTEFCDTCDSKGFYRKYGAFYIDGIVIPRHLQISREWLVKGSSKEFSEDNFREEREYFETNPHETQLQQIFKLANIDYGRIDYSVSNGKIVVFEINMNPQLVMPGESKNVQRTYIKKHFSKRLVAAFRKIDHPQEKSRSVSVDITPIPYLHLRPKIREYLEALESVEKMMIVSYGLGLGRFQPWIFRYLRAVQGRYRDWIGKKLGALRQR